MDSRYIPTSNKYRISFGIVNLNIVLPNCIFCLDFESTMGHFHQGSVSPTYWHGIRN